MGYVVPSPDYETKCNALDSTVSESQSLCACNSGHNKQAETSPFTTNCPVRQSLVPIGAAHFESCARRYWEIFVSFQHEVFITALGAGCIPLANDHELLSLPQSICLHLFLLLLTQLQWSEAAISSHQLIMQQLTHVSSCSLIAF